MPRSRTQLTISDMYIQNSKPNSKYVHSEYKTQFRIMISVTHFSTMDIGVRKLQLKMNCLRMFISGMFNKDKGIMEF